VRKNAAFKTTGMRCLVRTDFSLLGAFAKLRKATISFIVSVCLSVCPSVRMKQLGSNLTDFHEILVFEYFSKIYRENSSLAKI
jgi:hypothetical protein